MICRCFSVVVGTLVVGADGGIDGSVNDGSSLVSSSLLPVGSGRPLWRGA